MFLVNEGLKQSYWSTVFEGNQIATDARLKTQIESKPGFMYLFGGKVDHQKIDNDVAKLTSYYRSLGFFQAKVSRIIETADDGGPLCGLSFTKVHVTRCAISPRLAKPNSHKSNSWLIKN